MSWSGLASNQMVTFTNAQTSPFTLNAGQSPVTSNECMTKLQALTKYNLDASAMSAYANNQLVPKSVWVSGVVYYPFATSLVSATELTNACSFSFDTFTLYTTNSNGIVNVGDIVYYLDGGVYYPYYAPETPYISYNEGSTRKVILTDPDNDTGEILSKEDCSTSYSYEVRLGNSNAEACSAFTETVYSDSSIFAEGIVIYTTSALTTVVTGYTRVVDEAFNPYILDDTGVVGSLIGSC